MARGRSLASRMGYEFIDHEDLFFSKTDLIYEFSNPGSKEEAIQLLEERINNHSRFVFAVVKGDYGDKLINALDHIILVDVPKDVRSQRVRARSFQKFGSRICPGGELYNKEQKWFAAVDNRPDDYVLT